MSDETRETLAAALEVWAIQTEGEGHGRLAGAFLDAARALIKEYHDTTHGYATPPEPVVSGAALELIRDEIRNALATVEARLAAMEMWRKRVEPVVAQEPVSVGGNNQETRTLSRLGAMAEPFGAPSPAPRGPHGRPIVRQPDGSYDEAPDDREWAAYERGARDVMAWAHEHGFFWEAYKGDYTGMPQDMAERFLADRCR